MIFPAPQNWTWRVYFATSWSSIWGYLWTFNFWSLLRPRRPVKLLNIGYNISFAQNKNKTDSLCQGMLAKPARLVYPNGLAWSAQGDGLFFFSFWCSIFWGFIAQFNLLLPTCQPYWQHGKQTCQPHEKNTQIWTQPARISTPLPTAPHTQILTNAKRKITELKCTEIPLIWLIIRP